MPTTAIFLLEKNSLYVIALKYIKNKVNCIKRNKKIPGGDANCFAFLGDRVTPLCHNDFFLFGQGRLDGDDFAATGSLGKLLTNTIGEAFAVAVFGDRSRGRDRHRSFRSLRTLRINLLFGLAILATTLGLAGGLTGINAAQALPVGNQARVKRVLDDFANHGIHDVRFRQTSVSGRPISKHIRVPIPLGNQTMDSFGFDEFVKRHRAFLLRRQFEPTEHTTAVVERETLNAIILEDYGVAVINDHPDMCTKCSQNLRGPGIFGVHHHHAQARFLAVEERLDPEAAGGFIRLGLQGLERHLILIHLVNDEQDVLARLRALNTNEAFVNEVQREHEFLLAFATSFVRQFFSLFQGIHDVGNRLGVGVGTRLVGEHRFGMLGKRTFARNRSVIQRQPLVNGGQRRRRPAEQERVSPVHAAMGHLDEFSQVTFRAPVIFIKVEDLRHHAFDALVVEESAADGLAHERGRTFAGKATVRAAAVGVLVLVNVTTGADCELFASLPHGDRRIGAIFGENDLCGPDADKHMLSGLLGKPEGAAFIEMEIPVHDDGVYFARGGFGLGGFNGLSGCISVHLYNLSVARALSPDVCIVRNDYTP